MARRSVRVLARASLIALVVVFPISLRTVAQEQQRPPFRTGTNLVRVDAYPTRDGKIIPGLTAADFDVLEDGVLQKIDSFQFVEFPRHTTVEQRRDPNSQREGFQLASDPSYRVFVVYLDDLHVDVAGSRSVRMPLVNFLNRVLGPKDLFGVLTTRQRPDDLMLGQQTLFIEEQLTRYWYWGQGGPVPEPEEDLMLQACSTDPSVAAELVRRRRLDEVFSDLEGLIAKLGSIREERKNILLVSNGWPLPGDAPWLRAAQRPRMPSVGVTDAGKLTLGRTRSGGGAFDPRYCEDQLQRLSTMQFDRRFSDLLRTARQSNVTFYSIKPSGLSAAAGDPAHVDTLLTLSNNTDGVAVVNTNDLTGGAQRIADDLSAMYLLGYYPTNTKPDGKIRRITVRLKSTGNAVRARREYLAPSAADIAAMRAGPAPAPVKSESAAAADEALAELKRLRPGAVLHSRAAVIQDDLVLTTELTAAEAEAGRWKAGGDLQVMVADASGNILTTARGRLEPGQRASVVKVSLNKATGPFHATVRLRSATDGDAQDGASASRSATTFGTPLVYRGAGAGAPRPVGSAQFRRTERLQVRWPLNGDVAELSVRILGRDGVPLDLAVPIARQEVDGIAFAIADLNLAPLTAGEYILELSGSAPSQKVSALLAFRVTR